MRLSGAKSYESYSKRLLKICNKKPISLEVIADEFKEMEQQAYEIKSWGTNVYVKIPVMNTKRETSYDLVRRLSKAGVQLNITAMMTLEQVRKVAEVVQKGPPCFVSVFAGRIADTGVDPVPLMKEALKLLKKAKNAKLLRASPREVLNVYQAESIGCHVITATNDILKKLNLKGKDLTDFSQETVQMFYNDAQAAGFNL